jgi:hypothetical protein
VLLVPDPLLLGKCGRAGNLTWDLWILEVDVWYTFTSPRP